jgi:hypothetical protein
MPWAGSILVRGVEIGGLRRGGRRSVIVVVEGVVSRIKFAAIVVAGGGFRRGGRCAHSQSGQGIKGLPQGAVLKVQLRCLE